MLTAGDIPPRLDCIIALLDAPLLIARASANPRAPAAAFPSDRRIWAPGLAVETARALHPS